MTDHADTIRRYFHGRAGREDAEAALDALLAERQQAQADLTQAIDALRVYADARHWGISRDDLAVRVLSWIGPGTICNGVPDAMETARAALVSLGEKPQ